MSRADSFVQYTAAVKSPHFEWCPVVKGRQLYGKQPDLTEIHALTASS